MSGGRRTVARWIATSFGLGDLLPAPGTTAGSLPAAVLWSVVVLTTTSFALRLVLTAGGVLAFTAVGLWAAAAESRRRGDEDPGPVVIDEVAGQWLSYLVALPFVGLDDLRSVATTAVAGFLLFRVFDILKPWPVWRLERLRGGVGIMADDLAAAIYAGACVAVLMRWLG